MSRNFISKKKFRMQKTKKNELALCDFQYRRSGWFCAIIKVE